MQIVIDSNGQLRPETIGAAELICVCVFFFLALFLAIQFLSHYILPLISFQITILLSLDLMMVRTRNAWVPEHLKIRGEIHDQWIVKARIKLVRIKIGI